MEVKYKEYRGTLISLEKDFCYKSMGGEEYNTLSLSIQAGPNVVVNVTGVDEKEVVFLKKQHNFWRTANDPHEKNGLCLISWKSKSGVDFMVDMAWWCDGKWEGAATIAPPDFWALIPNPEEKIAEGKQ